MKKTKTDYSENLPEIKLQLTKSTFIKAKIKNSSDGAKILRPLFEDSIEIYESMFAIFLSRSNETIGWLRVSQGGLSGTVVDNRLILNAAIGSLCSGIIIAHNHPSGNTKPSDADLNVTQKLKNACSILEINLLDHLIITADSYLSLSDDGLI